MIEISSEVVAELVAKQFPRWAGLPVVPIPKQGWDNRTFRLGEELSVRLPSGKVYVAGVEKEDRVLPFLNAHLPWALPEPVATGAPGAGYPFPWSVRRWLAGETVEESLDLDRRQLAEDLGRFLKELRGLSIELGPAAGRHSHFRGCHLSVYSDQVEKALRELAGEVDVQLCQEIWLTATTSVWSSAPVWCHGDIAVGNMLVHSGRLSAMLDFGCCAIGDPACDLVMAWTYFSGDERQVHVQAAGLPDDAWERARGWALWKALVTMSGLSSPHPEGVQKRVLMEVLADPIV